MDAYDDLIAQSDDEMFKAFQCPDQSDDNRALVYAIDALRLVILACAIPNS